MNDQTLLLQKYQEDLLRAAANIKVSSDSIRMVCKGIGLSEASGSYVEARAICLFTAKLVEALLEQTEQQMKEIQD